MTLCLAVAVAGGIAVHARTAEPPKVSAMEVRRVDIRQTVEGAGRIEREGQQAVSVALPGIVEAVYVKEGQSVRAGQALFTLRNDDLAAQLERAYAECDRLRQAQRAVEGIAEVVSQQASSLIGDSLRAAERVAERIASQCAELTARAPCDAVVIQLGVRVGQVAAAGTAYALIGGERQVVHGLIADRDAAEVAPGQAAIVWVADAGYTGTVRDVSLAASEQATTTQAACRVMVSLDRDIALPVGSRVDIEIVTQQRIGAIGIPLEAYDEATGTVTMWSEADGTWTSRRVDIGLRDAYYGEALGGVSEGDRVEVH